MWSCFLFVFGFTCYQHSCCPRQNSIAVHVRLFLEELREPVCRALGVPLQPVVVVHEVYPEPDSVAVHPLEVVKERPCEVALHVGAVPAAASCIASRSDAAIVIPLAFAAFICRLDWIIVVPTLWHFAEQGGERGETLSWCRPSELPRVRGSCCWLRPRLKVSDNRFSDAFFRF